MLLPPAAYPWVLEADLGNGLVGSGSTHVSCGWL